MPKKKPSETTNPPTETVSACCNRKLLPAIADEGTCYYICSKCKRPADPKQDKKWIVKSLKKQGLPHMAKLVKKAVEQEPQCKDPLEEKLAHTGVLLGEDWRKPFSGSVDSKDEKPSVSPSDRGSKPTDPQIAPSEEWEIERVAMNIVYQIGDELNIKTEIRQATNDEFIDFAIKCIKSLLSSSNEKAREAGMLRAFRLIKEELENDPEEYSPYFVDDVMELLHKIREEL